METIDTHYNDLAKPQKKKTSQPHKKLFNSFKSIIRRIQPNDYFNYSGGAGATNSGINYPGVCGLTNLGNTCFMNSAVQCLSNTQYLTNLILSDEYKRSINKSNPLGLKGSLIDSYASLIKSMWSGKNSSTSPKNLRSTICRYAPQFSGYNQQDSQELLTYLLDGLHEELNMMGGSGNIIDVGSPSFDPGTNSQVADVDAAKESWQRHKTKNESAIMDLFHGQLKSRLTCPHCSAVSVVFEPFLFLSLPLPGYEMSSVTLPPKLVEICVMWYSGKIPPRRYGIRAQATTTVQLLSLQLIDMVGPSLVQGGFAMTQTKDGKIFSKLSSTQQVQQFYTEGAPCIMVFQFPKGFAMAPPSSTGPTFKRPVSQALASAPPSPGQGPGPGPGPGPATPSQAVPGASAPSAPSVSPAAPPPVLVFYIMQKKMENIQESPITPRKTKEYSFMGLPFILFTKPGWTNERFYKLLWTRLRSLLTPTCPLLFNDESSSDSMPSVRDPCQGDEMEAEPTYSPIEMDALLSAMKQPENERPFLVRVIGKNFYGCGSVDCSNDLCGGCVLSCDDTLMTCPTNCNFMIEWHPNFFELFYSYERSEEINEDTTLVALKIESLASLENKRDSIEVPPIRPKKANNIYDCLESFIAPEKLSSSNPWL
eukprot:TRINITY_DN255_c0_g1_i1.p1 TRINITY_DN255_c0_g1~~TRINITY_DN255_c0_g1_i1.p1  ORF type:complete len:650 (-),score=82.98 TRINITY_DN255_c0_g1_i1:498-2447(-)